MVIWETIFNVSIVFKERTRERNAGQCRPTGQEYAEYGVIRRAWGRKRDETPH